MKCAIRGSYLEVVFFMGTNEHYPDWFVEEIYNKVIIDESNYTSYVHHDERTWEYHEKQLISDYTVFLRKSNGEIHICDLDVFNDMYEEFRYDRFTNSGLAAFHEDVMDYVECQGGNVLSGYPDWFYEAMTEAINIPGEESIFIDSSDKEICITDHCVFLRNKFGEIKIISWESFVKFYDHDPGM